MACLSCSCASSCTGGGGGRGGEGEGGERRGGEGRGGRVLIMLALKGKIVSPYLGGVRFYYIVGIREG